MDTRFLTAVCAAGLLGWLGMSFGTPCGPAETDRQVVSADHADAHRLGARPAGTVDLPSWSERTPLEEEPLLVLAGERR
ncbi:MAG: hypothetical protein HKO57_09990 [Akkermansiaceae bacterium]|nr:hypothetical protein [Akkermansiaceae bacterium]